MSTSSTNPLFDSADFLADLQYYPGAITSSDFLEYLGGSSGAVATTMNNSGLSISGIPLSNTGTSATTQIPASTMLSNLINTYYTEWYDNNPTVVPAATNLMTTTTGTGANQIKTTTYDIPNFYDYTINPSYLQDLLQNVLSQNTTSLSGFLSNFSSALTSGADDAGSSTPTLNTSYREYQDVSVGGGRPTISIFTVGAQSYPTLATSGLESSAVSSASSPAVVAIVQSVYQGLLSDFTSAMDIQLGSNNSETGGDWGFTSNVTNPDGSVSQVFTPLSPQPDFSYPPDSGNTLSAVFNAFLKQYTPPASGATAATLVTNFISGFQNFIAGIATVSPESQTPYASLNSYESYYNAYAAPGAPSFQTFMQNFYSTQVTANGYFLPSQDFGAFIQSVQASVPSTGSSLISGTHSSDARILNNIVLLLIEMISTLQNVGIAQANNLQYLTQYQNAYTALLQQVPVFLADGSSPIGLTGANTTDATNDRNDINSSFNGILSDNLRSLRSVSTNRAKTVQSNINTTNDAVNQQTDMVTTFLQQMTQLLGSIFR